MQDNILQISRYAFFSTQLQKLESSFIKQRIMEICQKNRKILIRIIIADVNDARDIFDS